MPTKKGFSIIPIDFIYSQCQLFELSNYTSFKIFFTCYSFTPFYNNENHNHNLRNNILRLPMTRHEYFVQCTKYQLLKLIRETPQDDLNRCTQLNIIQFSASLNILLSITTIHYVI